MGYEIVSEQQLRAMTSLSHHVYEIANLSPLDSQAYVGQNAFAHKGGVRICYIKNPETYEHIRPELVGNKQEVTVSDQSGLSNLIYKAEKFDSEIDPKDSKIKSLVQRTKELEKMGFTFEEGEASFELLMRRKLGLFDRSFELMGFRVIDEKRGHDEEVIVEATVKVDVNGTVYHTAAEGEGPVDALNKALRKVLEIHFPQLNSMFLSDYKVRVLNSEKGTSSNVRVLIETTDGTKSWVL